MLHFLLGSLFVELVHGHGRLIHPVPRGINQTAETQQTPIAYQASTAPRTEAGYTGGSESEAWVCRGFDENDPIDVVAGEDLTVQWQCSACHTGDCDFYISYDVEKERKEMRWFKIGNFLRCMEKSYFPSCGSCNEQTLKIPSWVPSGRAILRFGWYATHLYPSMEFYSQCVDIQIQNDDDTLFQSLPEPVMTYTLIEPHLFPKVFNQANGRENEYYWEDGTDEDGVQRDQPRSKFMTGPKCAGGFTDNSCSETDIGTAGNLVPQNQVRLSDYYTAPGGTPTSTNPNVCSGYILSAECQEIRNSGNIEHADLCLSICTIDRDCTSFIYNHGTKICYTCSNSNPSLVASSGYTSGVKDVNCQTSTGTNDNDNGDNTNSDNESTGSGSEDSGSQADDSTTPTPDNNSSADSAAVTMMIYLLFLFL